ncbi:MAG: flagellar hook-length control protein FliK [Gallionella sp.]
MTSLPILRNSAPSSARGASADTALTRGDQAAPAGMIASAAQPGGAQGSQVPTAFSALLALHIGGEFGAGSVAGKAPAADSAATVDNTDPGAKNAHDQNAADPGIPGDQANPLAAMLLLPSTAENKPDLARLPQNNTAGQNIAETLQQSASKPANNPEDKPAGMTIAIPKANEVDSSAHVPLASVASSHAALGAATAIHAHGIQGDTKLDKPVTAVPGMNGGISGGITGGISTSSTANADQNISSPLGSSSWANEFSQKIVWMSNQQNHSAELHLNPPDLGPLTVVMKMSDNQLTAQFTSPHGAVRDAVESALPRLREVLADNNIMLGNATVSDQPPRDRNSGSDLQQESGSAAPREISYQAIESNTGLQSGAPTLPVRRHNGMLDTFA